MAFAPLGNHPLLWPWMIALSFAQGATLNDYNLSPEDLQAPPAVKMSRASFSQNPRAGRPKRGGLPAVPATG
jgi:hypothetical protein